MEVALQIGIGERYAELAELSTENFQIFPLFQVCFLIRGPVGVPPMADKDLREIDDLVLSGNADEEIKVVTKGGRSLSALIHNCGDVKKHAASPTCSSCPRRRASRTGRDFLDSRLRGNDTMN